MLQQTRVDVVIPYYESFLARFPDVGTLARAPLDTVLHAWAGLGYYSRARHLHAAAGAIVAEHEGQLPADPARLAALPGIGRYTAGAVASIAFGAPAPILDGNVKRVFARLFGFDGDVESSESQRWMWNVAARWARCESPGDANQALMELGATVCTKPVPACDRCPVAARCVARATGRAEQLPRPRRRAPADRVRLVAAIVRRGQEVLVVRRRSGRLLRDWWELPVLRAEKLERGAPESPGAGIDRVLRSRLGVRIATKAARPLGSFRHGILNHVLDVAVWEARARPGAGRNEPVRGRRRVVSATSGSAPLANLDLDSIELRWVRPSAQARLPFTTLTRKALRIAERANGTSP